MKGFVFYAPGSGEVRELERKVPARGEVLVKVARCGICGTDVHIFNGEEGSTKVKLPLIPGHEFSGTVW